VGCAQVLAGPPLGQLVKPSSSGPAPLARLPASPDRSASLPRLL